MAARRDARLNGLSGQSSLQAAERRPGDRDARPTAGAIRVLTIANLFGLPAIFFFSFFNRFAGVRSGAGEYAGGVLFLSGVLPYRDYFTAGPPLNTLKSALLLKLFGMTLLVSRSAGVTERLLLCGVLYLWLRRLFGRVPAVVASVATTIFSAADCTDPIASYNHDAILWAMLSGWLASRLLGRKQRALKGRTKATRAEDDGDWDCWPPSPACVRRFRSVRSRRSDWRRR